MKEEPWDVMDEINVKSEPAEFDLFSHVCCGFMCSPNSRKSHNFYYQPNLSQSMQLIFVSTENHHVSWLFQPQLKDVMKEEPGEFIDMNNIKSETAEFDIASRVCYKYSIYIPC